jgi:hypothetical protein
MRLLPQRNTSVFNGAFIDDFKTDTLIGLQKKIRDYSIEEFRIRSVDEWQEYLLSTYQVRVPILKIDDLYLDGEPEETTIYLPERSPFDGTHQNVSRRAWRFTVCIPYEGSQHLFNYQPNPSQDCSEMNITVRDNEIRLQYESEIQDATQIQNIYRNDVQRIEFNLKNMEQNTLSFNADMERVVSGALATREAEIKKRGDILDSIAIPIKRRTDIPATYTIPEIKRKPSVTTSAVTRKAQKPDPTLSEEEYENILRIIKDMALAMERSPSTFSKLDEPEIRDFFIILLNGHYQGMATGETFNGEGKTDILIRYENSNLFIAECKFWSGQKGLVEAIDQLFGYVTWRDTKTAIILFHKGKDLTAMLSKAEQTIKAHANFKSSYTLGNKELQSATIMAYKFSHPKDKEREILLSVLSYQVG